LKHLSTFLASTSYALLALASPSAFADGTDNVDRTSVLYDTSRVPVLGPAPVLVPRPVVPVAKEQTYSMMTLIFGAQGGMTYNDNIYRADNDHTDDLIATLSPKLELESHLDRHDFGFAISPEIGRYLSESKNNYFDVDAEAKARYDVGLSDQLFLNALYRRGHVAIGSFEDDPTSGLKEPVTYDLYEGAAKWEGRQNLLHYALGGMWDSYDYEDVLREDNTLNIQDDRDRDIYELSGKIGYEFSSPYVLYLKSSWNDRHYANRIDSSLLYPRDSNGYEVALGLSSDSPDGLLSFDAYIGYLAQNYDASELPDVGAPDVGFAVKWQATESDLVKVSLGREVKDTTTDGVSSSLQTRFSTLWTHTLSEKLSAGLDINYTDSDYQSDMSIATLDRHDRVYGAGANVRYALMKDLDMKLEYDYRNRDSNQPATDYDAHVVSVFLAVKY
jgi:hypothetical protein